MNKEELRNIWKKEEEVAHIKGWDFSYIHGRYEEENDLPWDYETIIKQYLTNTMDILDYDTGGGEFLLSLNHPYAKTSATEGYPPNVELCAKRLLPLGINFKSCHDPSHIPFANESFDLIINRHGDFDPKEIYRLLRPDGLIITEQVGEDNDKDLINMIYPSLPNRFEHLNLKDQTNNFIEAGFTILRSQEAYRPIKFFDVGAFVWYAHIIEWEFPNFSVERYFDKLLTMHDSINLNGKVEGTIHRYLIVAQK